MSTTEPEVKIPKKIHLYDKNHVLQTWTIERVKQTLLTNDEALKRAISLIYSFQTTEEKNHEGTIDSNGKGFSALDGYLMSSFAEQLLTKGWLSRRQLDIARRRMPKYAKQVYITLIPKSVNTIGKQLSIL